MNRKSFEAWLKALGRAWEDKNPQGAADICAENVVYYETPYGEPLRSPAEVARTWQEVPESQRDIHFGFEIITVNRKLGVARWNASFTRVPSGIHDVLDGIFVVTLNDEGLCTEFHQWWVVTPRA
jgi:hypothetical protein